MSEKSGCCGRSASKTGRQARRRTTSPTSSTADASDAAHRLRTEEIQRFRERLVEWFQRHRRRLPWRGDPPPFSTAAETKSASIRVRPEGDEAPSQKRTWSQSHCSLDRWIQTSSSKNSDTTASPNADLEKVTAKVEVAVGRSVEECTVQGGEKCVSRRWPSGEEPPAHSEAQQGLENEAFGVSAYGIWISEVMLQQTQVAVVLPYWIRWKQRWPTLLALAAASNEAVREAWAGLGYYQRAMRLLQAARHIVWDWYQNNGKRDIHLEEEQQDVQQDVDAIPVSVFQQLLEQCGKNRGLLWDVPFPRKSVETLTRLPGIGAYTAGAILSIAFGRKVPAVDGNAVRVMSRISGFCSTVSTLKLLKMSQAFLQEYMCETAPGDFNQGIMELGATLCTPRSPSCAHCPVNVVCRAYRSRAEKSLIMEPPDSKGRQRHGGDFDFVPACQMDTGSFCALCSPPLSPVSSPNVGICISDGAQGPKGNMLPKREAVDVGDVEDGKGNEGVAEWAADLAKERAACPRKKICKERPVAYYEALVLFVGNQKEGPRELLLRQRPLTGLLAGEWGPILVPQQPFPLTEEGTVRADASARAIWKQSLPDGLADVRSSTTQGTEGERLLGGVEKEGILPKKELAEHLTSGEQKGDERWSVTAAEQQRRAVLGTMRHIFSHVTHYVIISCIGFRDRKDAEKALVGLSQAPLRWIPCSGDRTQWVVDVSLPTKKYQLGQQRLNTGMVRVTRRLRRVTSAPDTGKHIIKDEQTAQDVVSSVEA